MNRRVAGARPRTLPAAIVPVAIGASVGAGEHGARWWAVVPALVVSLALQVGVNYANDYSDGVRGTDDVRVGPVRLVAGGTCTPIQFPLGPWRMASPCCNRKHPARKKWPGCAHNALNFRS